MSFKGQAMSRVAVAVTVGLVACKGPVPPVPGQGGPPWIELTSPHFTVWTDGSLNQAHELVLRIERLRQILVSAVFSAAPANGRELAIVLRDEAELRAFSGTDEPRPFAIPPEAPVWQPMIVLPASTREDSFLKDAAIHELVHAISYGVVRHQPRWFAEGMATYYETLGLDPSLGAITVGGPRHGGLVQIAHLVPIAELLAWAEAKTSEREERHYLTAWALFWFLNNQHDSELQNYIQLLNRLREEESEQRSALARRIWEQAFPTLPLATVDAQLRDWLFNGSHVEKTFAFDSQDPSITERQLGDADVYAIRGLLSRAANRDGRARGDVAAALAIEPTNVLARLLSLALDHTQITEDDARQMVDAHSNDWRAWMLVASTAHGPNGGEAETARARACALVAANPALMPPAKLCLAQRTQEQ